MFDDSPSGFDGSALGSTAMPASVSHPDVSRPGVPPTVAMHVFLNPSTRGPMAPDALADELRAVLRQCASGTALVTSRFQDTADRRDVRALFL